MSACTRSLAATLLGVLLAALLIAPAGTAMPPSPASAEIETADLAAALSDDGTFVGGAHISGTVDASAWTLTSNLAAGEPPRFVPADLTISSTASWAGLGSNGAGDGALNDRVDALAVSGSDVYVGGWFTNAAGIAAADYVARWNGTNWSALGSNAAGTNGALNSVVQALAVSGSDVYVGGLFTNAAGIATADYVARWNGTSWSALGSNPAGTDGALSDQVRTLGLSGSNVYVGGHFANAAGIVTADYVARWNGTSWSALGSDATFRDGALKDTVAALAVAGGNLYVGGSFINAADIATADYVARWNGTSWSALGSNGTGDGALNERVAALAVAGGDLYVGGLFTNAAGIAQADHVARWNGTSWSALGSNGVGDGALNSAVLALAVAGSDLYVGGFFINAADIATADRVARFGPILNSCTTAPFSDVAVDHPFCPEITWMKDTGISTGFSDGSYRPSIAVTRQAMSAFMARLAGAGVPPACTEPPFTDVPIDQLFCREIRWMKVNGISEGFPDGTYRPSIAVTRQAMSAFMARLAEASLTACTIPPFTDVPTNHPFCPEIKWMKDTGISIGFNDGTYRPSIEVTRQAMSAFMYRVSGLLL